MKESALLKILNHLAQLDIDSLHAYDQVIDTVKDTVVRERLDHFRNDHKQHVQSLLEEIRSRGGNEPGGPARDFKEYIVEGVMNLAEAAGIAGALNILKVSEEIIHRAYADAIPMDIPPDLKEIIRKHFSDEKIHLNYILSNT